MFKLSLESLFCTFKAVTKEKEKGLDKNVDFQRFIQQLNLTITSDDDGNVVSVFLKLFFYLPLSPYFMHFPSEFLFNHFLFQMKLWDMVSMRLVIVSIIPVKWDPKAPSSSFKQKFQQKSVHKLFYCSSILIFYSKSIWVEFFPFLLNGN